MAKKNGKRLNVAIASLLIVIIVWASSGLTSYVGNAHQTDDTAKDLVELQEDGCGPARVNGTSIAVIETKLETIEQDIGELRTEQRVDTATILKAIREN